MTPLGHALIQNTLCDAEEVRRCQNRAQQRQTSLAAELVSEGQIDGITLARFIATNFGYPLVDLPQSLPATATPIPDLPPDARYCITGLTGRQMSLAMADPTDDALISALRFQTGFSIHPQVADVQQLARVFAQKPGHTPAQTTLPRSDNPTNQDDLSDAPAVRYLQRTIAHAVEEGASDIHFEPYEDRYRVRLRIDGVLIETDAPPAELEPMLASRLKVLARLNIAEKRLPQDGQLRNRLTDGTPVDLRISTLPTLYGEKIVLRILDRKNAGRKLNQLGLNTAQYQVLQQALRNPSGMILVTGPTGSGKTVTLYACLDELNQPGVNIASAEDPVEIPVSGINQVNIDERTGLTFAVALRAFMRQDPDILMVGEIRDLDTAEIAVKAAQTGHLVLSTLHTRSAPASLERLRQLGLPAFNVAGSVLLIIAQRLVRKLCSCRTEDRDISTTALQEAGFASEAIAHHQQAQRVLYKAQGCNKCHHSGYRGRIGIFEIMPISAALQQIMIDGGSVADLCQQAQKEGMIQLRQAGLNRVMAGETSLNEILANTERL